MRAFAKLDSSSLKSSIEATSESPANQQKIIGTAERLEGILEEIKKLTREAQELVSLTPNAKDAELFWIGDIFALLITIIITAGTRCLQCRRLLTH